MKKPKIRELKEAVTSLITRPFTSEFPFKPHVPAKKFRGKPEYNSETCVGCGACFLVCPAKAIEMQDSVNDGSGRRIFIHHPKDCLFCGECERNCIADDGIKLTNVFDIAYFEEKDVQSSVEHNLVICRDCGEIIGAEKHLMWVFRKLGNLAFSQPVVLSRLMDTMELKTEAEDKITGPIQRTDALKIVCPGCRRIAFIRDEQKEK